LNFDENSKEIEAKSAFGLPKGLWQRRDLLSLYGAIKNQSIAEARKIAFRRLEREHWSGFFECLLATDFEESYDFKIRDGVCCFDSLNSSSLAPDNIKACLESLMPWRKGPFSFCGQALDAEWRSDKKWERVSPHLDEIEGKKIADVGCSNGYSMMRLLEHKPECVIGFDPGEAAFLQFEFCQKFLQSNKLQIELFKDDVLEAFPNFFEITLCMGVLYHHRSPLGLLKNLLYSTRPGGLIVVESQTYPGKGDFAFFNADRYAKAHNVYFVPTSDCLVSMLKKAGCRDVKLISEVEILSEEQRKSDFAPYQSLDDFLDEKDPSKTVEGHLAPTRSIVLGRVPS